MLFSYNTNQHFLAFALYEPQPAPITRLSLLPTNEIQYDGGNDEEALTLTEQQPVIPTVKNTFDVTLMVQRIRQLEKEAELFAAQLAEATWYYKEHIAKAGIGIDQIKLSIQGYFQQQGLRNLKTPSGTAYIKTLTVKHWSEPDVLVAWALANAPTAVRTKYEPDKRLLSDHIKKTGEIPDGYSEETCTKIYIK